MRRYPVSPWGRGGSHMLGVPGPEYTASCAIDQAIPEMRGADGVPRRDPKAHRRSRTRTHSHRLAHVCAREERESRYGCRLGALGPIDVQDHLARDREHLWIFLA